VLALASSSQPHDFAPDKPVSRAAKSAGTAPVAIFTAVVALLIWSVAPIPAGTVGYGRFVLTFNPLPSSLRRRGDELFRRVSEWPGGVRTFHVSGKVEASTAPMDMRLQAMLGNVPALLHPARSVLIVGFGAGITAGSFLPYPTSRKSSSARSNP